MNFNTVKKFEKTIAEFFNSPYAVATDCCTHGIELCLRYKNVSYCECPRHSYLSVPMTLIKLNINWKWNLDHWENFYYLRNTNIIDAAVYWKKNGYVPGTFMVLSFQFKKHLNLGRGGVILCDNYKDYCSLKKLSYDGRIPDVPWKDQKIDSLGYHYYMTPETAQSGLDKIKQATETKARDWSWQDYPDLRKFEIFEEYNDI